MVVSDCYIEGIAVDKPKTHAPLVVDANAPLPGPVSVQCFQTVGGGKSQLFHLYRVFKLIQPKYRAAQDVRGQSAGFSGAKQAYGFFVSKAVNHVSNHKQFVYNSQE
jgi:hypothetical protein